MNQGARCNMRAPIKNFYRMRHLITICLLALLSPLSSHAQQRIKELIKSAQASNADIEVRTTISRNPQNLKIESESKYIVFNDKALTKQFKEALIQMAEQAKTFEHITRKNEEEYRLTFEPANSGKSYYNLSEEKETTTLKITTYAK